MAPIGSLGNRLDERQEQPQKPANGPIAGNPSRHSAPFRTIENQSSENRSIGTSARHSHTSERKLYYNQWVPN